MIKRRTLSKNFGGKFGTLACRPSVRPSVRLSLCNAVHCGSKGRCTGLKVVPAWACC